MTIIILIVLFFFLCKPHWTHYFDQSGLAVQHVLVRVDPESGQLGQDVDHLEGLEVVDEDVGQPEVLDKLHTGGHHHSLRGVGGDHVQPWLVPLHVEVHGDRDAVVLVVDMPHLVNVHGDADHVGLVCGKDFISTVMLFIHVRFLGINININININIEIISTTSVWQLKF